LHEEKLSDGHEEAKAEVGGVAEGKWALDAFWKDDSERAAEAAPAVVVALFAKAFELQRAALLWSEMEDTVLHLRNDSDGVQIDICEFRMSLDKAAQFFAEHGGHKRFR